MANVAHATLSGSDLHEPKGIGSAGNGTVYVANGSGSGTWTAATSIFSITGMVADFATPVPPSGWLECNGAAISRTSFASLFSALTISQNGNRNGSTGITGLTDTSNIGVGYYVSGTGIPVGTTVTQIVNATTVIISNATTSTGTSAVTFSPWPLGDGVTTFNIPNAFSGGRYRRSRGLQNMGQMLAESVTNHTHSIPQLAGTLDAGQGTNNSVSLNHSHSSGSLTGNINNTSGTVSGSVDSAGAHTHSSPVGGSFVVNTGSGASGAAGSGLTITANTSSDGAHQHGTSALTTNLNSSAITVNAGSTGAVDLTHNHFVGQLALTTNAGFNTGGNDVTATENRPVSLVVMTCIKT